MNKTFLVIISLSLILFSGCNIQIENFEELFINDSSTGQNYTWSSQKIQNAINSGGGGGGNLNVSIAKNTTVSYSGDVIENVTTKFMDGQTLHTTLIRSGDTIIASINNLSSATSSNVTVINFTYSGDSLVFVEYN